MVDLLLDIVAILFLRVVRLVQIGADRDRPLENGVGFEVVLGALYGADLLDFVWLLGVGPLRGRLVLLL